MAIRTTQDVVRIEPSPKAIQEHRLDELPEFIVTELRNGSTPEGRFTQRRLLTAGGLSCDVTTMASSAYGPSTCEVNQPIPNPERFASLTASIHPAPPFATTERDTL